MKILFVDFEEATKACWENETFYGSVRKVRHALGGGQRFMTANTKKKFLGNTKYVTVEEV